MTPRYQFRQFFAYTQFCITQDEPGGGDCSQERSSHSVNRQAHRREWRDPVKESGSGLEFRLICEVLGTEVPDDGWHRNEDSGRMGHPEVGTHSGLVPIIWGMLVGRIRCQGFESTPGPQAKWGQSRRNV